MFEAVCRLRLEGIFSKKVNSTYQLKPDEKLDQGQIRNPRLPPGLLMVRSEYSPLSVVRRNGSAAQTKHTNKNRKTMATNATALCARVISISTAYSGATFFPAARDT